MERYGARIPPLPYPDPELADDAIRLRPWMPDDVPDAHRAMQDPAISHVTRVPAGQTEADVRAYVAGLEPARLA